MHQLQDLRKITFATIFQSLFLTVKYYLQNGLFSYASACSFDFLFSVVPLLMMVVSVLVRVLHASEGAIEALFKTVPELENYISPESIFKLTTSISGVNLLDVVLVLFVVWMARRFFASVFAAMRRIFHDQQKRRPLINQILAVAFELIIVVTAVSIIFSYLSLKTILTLPVFQTFPQLSFIFEGFLSEEYVAFLPNFLIFSVITILYKGAAGTKPSFKLCALAGFLCTGSFWVFRFLLHMFLNTGRYNLIYGVLGQLIIIMMDLFFFFVFFLFFAQLIFIIQFFDDLLLGEIYLLPKADDAGKFLMLYRKLFIRPDYLMAKYSSVTLYNKGELIYSSENKISYLSQDNDDTAYYVIKGNVTVTHSDSGKKDTFGPGQFFGELNCILGEIRSSSAEAVSDCQIVAIKGETFRLLVEQNPFVAQEVLGQVSSYFTTNYIIAKNENVL